MSTFPCSFHLRLEQEELKEVLAQLEEENQGLRRKTLKLEKELRRQGEVMGERTNTIADLKMKLKVRI